MDDAELEQRIEEQLARQAGLPQPSRRWVVADPAHFYCPKCANGPKLSPAELERILEPMRRRWRACGRVLATFPPVQSRKEREQVAGHAHLARMARVRASRTKAAAKRAAWICARYDEIKKTSPKKTKRGVIRQIARELERANRPSSESTIKRALRGKK